MLPGDSRESTPKEEVKVINESSLEMISCGHLQQMAKGTSLEEGGFHWAPQSHCYSLGFQKKTQVIILQSPETKETPSLHKPLLLKGEWQPLNQNQVAPRLTNPTWLKLARALPGKKQVRQFKLTWREARRLSTSSLWLICCVRNQYIAFYGSQEVKWFYFWITGVVNCTLE